MAHPGNASTVSGVRVAPPERSKDPTREVALIALGGGHYPNDTLREVIDYAFDQLCWSMTTPDLEELLSGLRAKLEDA